MMPLIYDVQNGLPPPKGCGTTCYMVRGKYEYYHYKCDGTNDMVSTVQM